MFFISDGSDLHGIRRIQDMKYIKILRMNLRIISAWPASEMGDTPTKWDIYGKYVMMFRVISVFIMQILYIKEKYGNISFFELGHSYITCFMNVVDLSRNCIIFQKSYHEISRLFLTDIHLFNRKEDSEYSMKIHILVHKLSHFFTMYINVTVFCGIILFNVTPLYHNVKNGAFNGNSSMEHSVYYKFPFDSTTDIRGYIAVFFFNWYSSFTCTIAFCSYDLFLSLFVFHIWGHLKILINNLENFPRPKVKRLVAMEYGKIEVEWYTAEEQVEVLKRLKELVYHHRLISSFNSKISETFGVILFIYMGFHQICGCILLLECSTLEPDALFRYAPLTVTMFQQLIQVSMIFDLIGTITDKLGDAVYQMPWEVMEVRHRRIVNIMLRQAQLSQSTKAMGLVSVGSGTMMAILKTSLSYFVMLRTFVDD